MLEVSYIPDISVTNAAGFSEPRAGRRAAPVPCADGPGIVGTSAGSHSPALPIAGPAHHPPTGPAITPDYVAVQHSTRDYASFSCDNTTGPTAHRD